MRRWGERIERGRTYRRRPGVYAILPREGPRGGLMGGDLLLTVQLEPRPEVQLPGGGVDPGEDPGRALHREVREETGWSIGRPRRLGAFRRWAFMPEYDLWAEKVCHVWLARPARRLGPPGEAGHLALWAPAKTALDLLENPGERDFLARLLRM